MALMEFSGLRAIPVIVEELKISALTMLLMTSWGIYLGGVIRLAFLAAHLPIRMSTIVTLISGT